MCSPCGSDVAVHRVGGEEVHVAVSTGGEHHGMRSMTGDLTSEQVPRHDPGGASVDYDDVDQLTAIEQPHATRTDLSRQLLIRTKEQLLTRLTAGVERAAHLRTTKASVVEEPAVLTGKWDTLGNHLVDDVHRYLRQSIHVSFTRTEVATFDGVGEQTRHAVAVPLIIFGRIDSALSSNGVRASCRVVEGEGINLIPEFSKRCRSRGTGQTRTNDDHLELAFVVGVDQLGVRLERVPLVGQCACGHLGIELCVGGGTIFEHGHVATPFRR